MQYLRGFYGKDISLKRKREGDVKGREKEKRRANDC